MRDAGPLALVAIGASAGGIEAFRQFFARMPVDSGLAFVVVLHLAAGRRSMLPEILARWTGMPVTEAQDGTLIERDRVLVIPAGVVAKLREGRVFLRPVATDAPRIFTPIDAFFDSVATAFTDNAIGVILSGTGHDGSLGLKAIKAQGGLTLAQSGEGGGPEYPGMPTSAVAVGAVDLYVRVEEISRTAAIRHQIWAKSVRRFATSCAPGWAMTFRNINTRPLCAACNDGCRLHV
jgi:two-component system CheB/CheR fusion protein